MRKERSVKQRLISAVLVLVMLFTSLLGTTFAWFTDSVSSEGNQIVSGSLKVDLLHKADGVWTSLKQKPDHKVFEYDNWEPGYTQVDVLRVDNLGSLALKYQLSLEVAAGTADIGENGAKLADVIDVYVADGEKTAGSFADITKANGWTHKGTLSKVMQNPADFLTGQILPTGEVSDTVAVGSQTVTIALHMQESAGNEYQNLSAGDIFVNLIATQWTYEKDSFGDDYDDKAEFPEIDIDDLAIEVEVENGMVKTAKSASRAGVSITIPAGVKVDGVTDGTTTLVLSVDEKEKSDANVTLSDDEILRPLDVHVEGVSEQNEEAIVITIEKAMPSGLNIGNYTLYHVENGVSNEMTAVTTGGVDTHNEFKYDPATGDTTLGLATFSEVAAVVETTKAWNGEFDYDWYDADATELTIANADQLAAFGAIVGGMNGQAQDSFKDKTVKLLADINLGDKENVNTSLIFHPIGYYYTDDKNADGTTGDYYSTVYSFEGTFDGNGNTISNFYQNTWEIKGDYSGNYYSDAMGLFGYVVNGTVKNLTVDNFSSDGEFTPTGVIAAYAANSTFENIAITNCNPRVYNTGNGGIVGIGGNSNDPDTYKLTFTNITIDNTNKITALWGSWDVACGGLVGMFRGAGHAYMTNCHVAAQIDVYNDVCGNYQYYWYRYSGMMIGTNKNMTTDDNGYTVPETSKFHAKDCTVHFGEWNDYYYCELVANSLASYTHDHQFSRLTEISSLDEIKSGDTWTKTGNYLLVSGDTKTCYHIVKNADGTLKQHLHTDAGEETVNGETVLKEDKQIVYLPFNQLFTGYGWGVKHIPIYDDGTPNPFAGVTILDRTEANSVVKFNSIIDSTLPNNIKITASELVEYLENCGVDVHDESFHISITDLNSFDGIVTAEFIRGGTWEESTIAFTGTGTVAITIQDYYFCTPTTIEVEVTERQEEEKFDIVMNNGDFLHRVGNDGTVALDKLFKAKDGVTVGTVSVTVEAVNGTGASGTYSNNAIQFNGTGVVKVTITDNDYCIPTELYLEVVKAKNITSAAGSNGTDVVLLNDVTFSGTYLYYKNSILYGNGFKIDITDADHSDLKDSSDTNSNKSAYCNIWMVDSRFDNVKIEGSVYPEVGMTADSDYGNAAIRTEGDCYITNSYISNCRVPLRVQGNTTLIDTVVDGGRYANIELRSGKLTLDGVTTINTVRTGSDGTTDVIGFGIVIHSEAANASISVIGDGLKQYNWVGENEHETILSGDTYLEKAYNLIFNANNSDTIYFDYNGDRYVNTGVLCLCAAINKDVVTGLDDRYYQEISGYDAWVLTYDNSKHTKWFEESVETKELTWSPSQYPVIPKYTGNDAQTIEFTKGETYYFDTSVLTATKFGQSLTISSVVLNGNTYNYGDKIAITEGGIYEVVYTVVDPYNYNADATPATPVNHTVSITVTAVAKDAEILAPKFTFIDQNGNKYESTTVKIGDKTYVMPNVTAADSTTNSMSSINIGSASISGTTVYFPIATGYTVRSGSNFNRYYPLFNGINITDYTVAGDTIGTTYTTSGNYTSLVGSSGTKFIIPANGGQTNCGDYVKTDGQSGNAAGNSDSGWQGAGYSTSYGGTYLKSGNTNASSGADSNGYERIVWVEYCFNAGNGDVYYYRIGYHCNKESAQSCVTPDTLVTLADGTQKRIDELTFDDKILAWDFFTGTYVEKNISILVNHGEANYRIANLGFSDGSKLRIIGDHGIFDYDLNKFVYLTVDNMSEYIGHRFVKYAEDGAYDIVTLTDAYATEEYTSAWSITSAGTSNAFASGMLTVAPPEDFYNWIEMSDKLLYDAEQFQRDVETYGLYTYDDFKDYVTYEQFVDWNGAYLKIAVEKGYFTFDYILELIELYKGWMP